MVFAFFEEQRRKDKDYSNPPRQPQTTSSTSAPKPKVGAEKLSDLSQRLEKAISKIVGTSTVATEKKTPSKTVKPKKKTPPKRKLLLRSKLLLKRKLLLNLKLEVEVVEEFTMLLNQ